MEQSLVVYTIFMIVGIACFIVSYLSYLKQEKKGQKCTEITIGKVTKLIATQLKEKHVMVVSYEINQETYTQKCRPMRFCKLGRTLPVHYNPEDPKMSYVSNQMETTLEILLKPIGFLLILFGIIGICYFKKDVPLTERQKSILSGYGYPTNYNYLPRSYQKAIQRTEEMFSYLDHQYEGVKFNFVIYYEKSDLEEEQLIVSLPGVKTTCQVIEKNDKFIDNCQKEFYQNDYHTALLEETQKLLQCNDCIKLYTEVVDVKQAGASIYGNVTGNNTIFLNQEQVSEAQFQQFISNMKTVLNQRQLYGTVRFGLIQNISFQKITEYDFTDYIPYSVQKELVKIKNSTTKK